MQVKFLPQKEENTLQNLNQKSKKIVEILLLQNVRLSSGVKNESNQEMEDHTKRSKDRENVFRKFLNKKRMCGVKLKNVLRNLAILVCTTVVTIQVSIHTSLW